MPERAPSTSGLWDDHEYPYHPQYVTDQAFQLAGRPPVVAPGPRWTFPWRAVLRWTRRLAIAGAGIVVLGLVLLAAFGHRIISRSLLVAQLESRGCQLTFVHQLSGEPDPLHPLVRKVVGDGVASEVVELLYFADAVLWNSDAEDLAMVCQSSRQLDKLRSLAIVSNSFSLDQIEDLPQLGQLEKLEIGSLAIADDDLALLERMKNLRSLKVRAANATARAIPRLAALPKLEVLEVYGVQTAASDPPGGAGFPLLTRLVINETTVIDESILGLGQLPALEEIELSHAAIGDQGLAHLLASRSVRSLVLNDAVETEINESALVRCPGPDIFYLAGTKITDAGLAPLKDRRMTSLVLDGTQVTDQGLAVVGTIDDLRYLSLRDTKVTGVGATHLSALKYLTQLDLRGAHITSAGAAALAKLRLSELVLANTPLTDEALMRLADCDSLGLLDITGTAVTAHGLRAFYEARKRRLAGASRSEMLFTETEHASVVAEYVSPEGLPPHLGGAEYPPYGF